MKNPNWTAEFPGSIMVCDLNGIILEMNERAAKNYERYGGMELIGKSVIECHPEPSRSKLVRLLETGESNIYTVEKSGIRKMVYQAPWSHDGRRSGIVEVAFEIPFDVPNFVRK